MHLTGNLGEAPRGIFTRYMRDGEPAVYATGGWSAIPTDALNFKHEKKKVMEITTQLGCPYGCCTFCDWATLTPHKIIADADWVLYCIEYSEPKIVIMRDASFLADNTENSLNILRGLKKLKEEGKLRKEFELGYHARAEAFPENEKDRNKFLELMIGAGTKHVQVGFESGSERVLREFKKGRFDPAEKREVLLERNVLAVDAIAKANFGCYGTFILASPQSELSDVIKTLGLITYIAKVTPRFDIDAIPSVSKSNKSPLCQFGSAQKDKA